MRMPKQLSSKGFTVIELLIASAIFALVLILITTGILQFSRQYYKGVLASKTQNTARTILNDITRAIQLNSGEVYTLQPTGPARGFCIGEVKRYSYILDRKIVDSGTLGTRETRHALVTDDWSGCSASTNAVNASATSALGGNNARELLSQNMRLSNLSITGSQGLYTVTVRVVYGDEDLLCSPSVPSSCAPNGAYPPGRTNIQCKSTVGSEFCAVSELSTTVQKRVN
jgi:prepilin-type N-terminal cleavage/methylation domain-containing protein